LNRDDALRGTTASVISVLGAFGIGSLIIASIGKNPSLALFAMFSGALGGYYGLGSTLNLGAVLMLTGLAAVVSFSAGIWNIGMEGQLYVGSLSSVIVAFGLPGIGVITLFLAFAIGAITGGLYSALAGVLKAKFKVNEIVSTIMLNYVALLLVDWVAGGPLHKAGSALNETPPIADQLKLPTFPGSTVQPTIIIAIVLGLAIAFLLKRTKVGFELRMMRGNYRAAEYTGVRTARQVILAMFLSGGLAGLAGCFLVFGSSYSVFDGISRSYGYLGIGVALLASLNPVVSVLSALLFAILDVGGITMQAVTGVPSEIAEVMSAIIVIVILVRPLLVKVISRWL